MATERVGWRVQDLIPPTYIDGKMRGHTKKIKKFKMRMYGLYVLTLHAFILL